LELPLVGVAFVPLYTDGKNIEKDIAEAYAKHIIIHEMEHFVFDRKELENPELSVSALHYITYIDMYNLLKYPETYKIVEENIIVCKKYIEKTIEFMVYLEYMVNFSKNLLKYAAEILKRAPYDLGYCYGNIIIDRKKTPYLNIKDVVEEVKNLSILDAITKIENYRIKK
jgi:hypothetical protein